MFKQGISEKITLESNFLNQDSGSPATCKKCPLTTKQAPFWSPGSVSPSP